MPHWNLGLRILNGADLEPKLATPIRESASRAGAHYVQVTTKGGDLSATLVFDGANEKEAAENGDVVLNDLRPVLRDLGVDSKNVTFSITGWPEATT